MSSPDRRSQVADELLARWHGLDRGWQATVVATLVTVAVLLGVPVPW